MPSADWKALLQKFPDALFIPEFAGAPETFAYAFNYQEYDMGFRGTSGRIRRIYPKACSMAVIEDASPHELFDVMVQNVRDGDILRTFSYGINRNVKMIRNIYAEGKFLDAGPPKAVQNAGGKVGNLVALLGSKDRTIQYYAAKELGGLRGKDGESVVGPLIKAASDEKLDWNVRRAAIVSLGAQKEKALGKLPGLLKLMKHETLSYDVSRTIGQMGHGVLPKITELAEKTSGRDQLPLIDVMGFVGAPRAVPFLEKAGAPNAFSSRSAYKALARIGDQAAVEALGRLIVVDDMPIYQRGAVATALGDTGNPMALTILKAAREYAKGKQKKGDGIDWGNFNWRIGNAERHLKSELRKKGLRQN